MKENSTTAVKSYLFKKLGWTGIIVLSIFVILSIWVQIQKYQLRKNPSYAIGIIGKKEKGSKGSTYYNLTFYVNGVRIEGSIPLDIRYQSGDSINIKYQADNPRNFTLMKE